MLLAILAVSGAVYLAYVHEGPRERAAARPSPDTPTAPAPAAGGSLAPRSPAPVRLTGVDAFRARFRKPPSATLVFDVDSGEVLYRSHPLRVLPMASLTKIMTALLVARQSRPKEPVRITAQALRYSGTGVGLLPKGKRVRLEALLNGLMIVSANDAAIALAIHTSGSQRRFVGLMNEQAHLWGLTCTSFASAHGLERGNRSCAADLAVMTRLAMRNKRIAQIARRSSVSFRFPIEGGKLYLAGHNPLIRLRYPGAIGLKTGYTDDAGRCFVGVARRNGRQLGVVVLDSPDPGRQSAKLLDLAFQAR